MRNKSAINNCKSQPYVQSRYSCQSKQTVEKFAESSFLQVNSMIQSSETNSEKTKQKLSQRSENSDIQINSKQAVQNICNQIKYLIEGNLKNDQLGIDMSDIVRDNIIPMLIKMFFQQSVDKKTGFFDSKQMSSTFQSKNRDNQYKVSMKQNWQAQSAELFKPQDLSKENINYLPRKSSFMPQNLSQEIQYNGEQQIKLQKLHQSNQISKKQIQKFLFLTILLLKYQILSKKHSFQKLKQFSIQKQRLIKQFIGIFANNRVKNCLKKFQQNRFYIENKKTQLTLMHQTQIFKQKTTSISCQVIIKILKKKIINYYAVFKQNILRQNKWMRQWVKMAALKSPLTLKTSVWRLKNFLQNQNLSPMNKKTKKQIQTSIKQIIIAQQVQFIKTNTAQLTKKQLKKSQGNISEKDSSSQSITSTQYDAMFQNESEQGIINSQQSIKKNGKSQHEIQQQEVFKKNKKQNQEHNKEQQSDGYLNTISEDENQLQSACF